MNVDIKSHLVAYIFEEVGLSDMTKGRYGGKYPPTLLVKDGILNIEMKDVHSKYFPLRVMVIE